MKTISAIGMRLRKSRWFSKYSIAFSIFFIWMLFFDKHNVFVQYRLRTTLNHMEKQIENYGLEAERAKQEQETLELETERYAREKYFMHRPDEEVFVIRRD